MVSEQFCGQLFFLLTVFLLVNGCASTSYDPVLQQTALNPVTAKNTPQHQPLRLVEDGEFKFAIIVDQKAEKHCRYRSQKSITIAVELLQEAFDKCFGRAPEVIDIDDKDLQGQYPFLLLLGESASTKELGIEAQKLPQEGFELKTFATGLAIVGNDSSLSPDFSRDPLDRLGPRRGTLHGAYDFVERYLGCRFFFPGQYGSLWPKLRNLTVNPANYYDYPRFANRSPSYRYLHISCSPGTSKAFMARTASREII